jgi:hypothetical protein
MQKINTTVHRKIYWTISSMLVPTHIWEHFDILDTHEYADRWAAPCAVRSRLCPFAGLVFIDKYMGFDSL